MMERKELILILCLGVFVTIFDTVLVTLSWVDYQNTGNMPSSTMIISILITSVFLFISVYNAIKEFEKAIKTEKAKMIGNLN